MKRKLAREVVFSLIILAVLGPFTACAAPVDEVAPFPIEVTDQLGRLVGVEKVPERIISLAPSNTEILFALGLEDNIVAVTDYSDYPQEAKLKPSMGSYKTPNIESIVAMSPDLILATDVHEANIIPALERLNLPVVALAPQTLDDVLDSINLIGEITGKQEAASRLVAEMSNRIRLVTAKTANLSNTERPRVLYVVWHDPLTVPGSGTFQDDLITKAGGTNIIGDLSGWVKVSLETVLEANPEVMIAGVGHVSVDDLIFQFIKTELRLRDTDARRKARVYEVQGDLVSRTGPRIVDGLETFAALIHPELFR